MIRIPNRRHFIVGASAALLGACKEDHDAEVAASCKLSRIVTIKLQTRGGSPGLKLQTPRYNFWGTGGGYSDFIAEYKCAPEFTGDQISITFRFRPAHVYGPVTSVRLDILLGTKQSDGTFGYYPDGTLKRCREVSKSGLAKKSGDWYEARGLPDRLYYFDPAKIKFVGDRWLLTDGKRTFGIYKDHFGLTVVDISQRTSADTGLQMFQRAVAYLDANATVF